MRCQLMKLGRQSVANDDITRCASGPPHFGQAGAGEVDDETSSSNRISHASQTYS